MTLTNQIDANFINTDFIFEDRLDAHYYSNKFHDVEKKIKSSPFEVKKFIDVAKKIKCGPFGSSVLAENYDETGIIMVRPLNLKNVLLSNEDLVRFPEDALGNKSPIFKHKDLLFARVGMPSCSIIPKTFENVTISPNIIAAELTENDDPYYIATFMNTSYGLLQIERRFKAVSQPTVSTEELKTLAVPLPDFKYQRYIGDKIRKAEKLRKEANLIRQEAINIFNEQLNLKEFKSKNSLSWYVEDALLEPYLNVQYYNKEYLEFQKHLKKRGIKVVHLSSVLERIIKNSSPDTSERSEFGIPSLIVSDIDPYKIEITNSKIRVNSAYYDRLVSDQLIENDVLFTTAGPPLGEACLVVKDMLPLLSGAHVAALRTNNKVTAGYLTVVLNSIVGQLEVEKHSYGIRQQYIFGEQLRKFLIPMLDMHLQEEIHEKISYSIESEIKSNMLIDSAKKDVESLLEGSFDESCIK